jgi:hypothetical protein
MIKLSPEWMRHLSNIGMKECKQDTEYVLQVKQKFKFPDRASIFLTGFIQVALVSAQTHMVARSIYQGVFIIGFLISLVWSVNVKKIAFGGWIDRIVYSVGAGVGAVVGLCVAVAVARK